MSVLLSDVSLCTNEFSRILFSSVNDWNLHVEVPGISTAGSAFTQHIEYRIVVTAVPRNSLEHDAKSFLISARFKELNRLWNQLSKIHKQLYLHGVFPLFAPTKLFGNTEPAVIAERVDAITRFLNFAFRSEVLRKAISLHHFFEGVVEVSETGDRTQPVTLASRSRALTSGDEITVDTSASEGSIDQEGSILSPGPFSSNHPVSNESAPEGLRETNWHAHMNPTTSVSSLVPRTSSSCALFDFPDTDFQSIGTSSDAAPTSSSRVCIRGSHSSESLSVLGEPRSFVRNVLPKFVQFTGHQRSRHSETPDELLRGFFRVQRPVSSGSFYERTPITGLQSPTSSSHSASDAVSIIPSLPSSLDASSSRANNDYLHIAGQFISAAQKAEAENAFELAFQCYKSAVKALLQGVQFERDLSRRNRVRKKTAKYLLKAEKLYRSYLSFDGSAFEAASWLSNAVQDPSLLAFQSSNGILKSFRIINVLPSFKAKKRVYLVENRTYSEDIKFVMKMLEKSSSDKSYTNTPLKSIIPVDVPHMVQLHKFFDTESYIILLLEYLKYGRLWDFLEDYFAEQQQLINAVLFYGHYNKEDTSKVEEPWFDKPSTSAVIPHSVPMSNTVTSETNSVADAKLEPIQRQNTYEDYSYRPQNFNKLSKIVFEVLQKLGRLKRLTFQQTEAPVRSADFLVAFLSGKHVRFSVGDADEATDLARTNGVDSVLMPFSVEICPSSKGIDGLVMKNEVGSSMVDTSSEFITEYSGFNTDIESVQDTINVSKGEEEAPAPIRLCSNASVGDDHNIHSKYGTGEPSLREALEKARLTLKERRRWNRRCQLPEILIAYWISQLTSAVYFLHSQGIIIRDLRPENLLLDEEANLKLTFCSQWQCVVHSLDDTAITDFYAAPETVSVFGKITGAADRWSIGVILFELLCGEKLSEICLHGFETLRELPIPECINISFAARDLLSKLLLNDPSERASDDELRAHPFFEGIDWAGQDHVVIGFHENKE